MSFDFNLKENIETSYPMQEANKKLHRSPPHFSRVNMLVLLSGVGYNSYQRVEQLGSGDPHR